MARAPIDPAMLEPLLDGLRAQENLASATRMQLLERAHRRRRMRKIITFTTGVMALLSGGSTATLFATDQDFIKIISALLALGSGAISLATGIFYDDEETKRINEGAVEFGALSLELESFLAIPEHTVGEAERLLGQLKTRRLKLFQDFDQVIDVNKLQDAIAQADMDRPHAIAA